MGIPLKAAILIVSTTVSRGVTRDATAQILHSVFDEEGDGRWDVVDVKTVDDNTLQIQDRITKWADGVDGVNLIVTSGGTGFAASDQTPEVRPGSVWRATLYCPFLIYFQAVSVLLHKHAPGLVHGMLASSLNVTPCEWPRPLHTADYH